MLRYDVIFFKHEYFNISISFRIFIAMRAKYLVKTDHCREFRKFVMCNSQMERITRQGAFPECMYMYIIYKFNTA